MLSKMLGVVRVLFACAVLWAGVWVGAYGLLFMNNIGRTGEWAAVAATAAVLYVTQDVWGRLLWWD